MQRSLQPGALTEPVRVWCTSTSIRIAWYQAEPLSEQVTIFYKKTGSLFGTEIVLPTASLLGPDLSMRGPDVVGGGTAEYYELDIRKLKQNTQYVVKVRAGAPTANGSAPNEEDGSGAAAVMAGLLGTGTMGHSVRSDRLSTLSPQEEAKRNLDMGNFIGSLIKLGEYDGTVLTFDPATGLYEVRVLQVEEVGTAPQLLRLASEYSDLGLPVRTFTLSSLRFGRWGGEISESQVVGETELRWIVGRSVALAERNEAAGNFAVREGLMQAQNEQLLQQMDSQRLAAIASLVYTRRIYMMMFAMVAVLAVLGVAWAGVGAWRYRQVAAQRVAVAQAEVVDLQGELRRLQLYRTSLELDAGAWILAAAAAQRGVTVAAYGRSGGGGGTGKTRAPAATPAPAAWASSLPAPAGAAQQAQQQQRSGVGVLLEADSSAAVVAVAAAPDNDTLGVALGFSPHVSADNVSNGGGRGAGQAAYAHGGEGVCVASGALGGEQVCSSDAASAGSEVGHGQEVGASQASGQHQQQQQRDQQQQNGQDSARATVRSDPASGGTGAGGSASGNPGAPAHHPLLDVRGPLLDALRKRNASTAGNSGGRGPGSPRPARPMAVAWGPEAAQARDHDASDEAQGDRAAATGSKSKQRGGSGGGGSAVSKAGSAPQAAHCSWWGWLSGQARLASTGQGEGGLDEGGTLASAADGPEVLHRAFESWSLQRPAAEQQRRGLSEDEDSWARWFEAGGGEEEFGAYVDESVDPPQPWTYVQHAATLYSVYLQEWLKHQLAKSIRRNIHALLISQQQEEQRQGEEDATGAASAPPPAGSTPAADVTAGPAAGAGGEGGTQAVSGTVPLDLGVEAARRHWSSDMWRAVVGRWPQFAGTGSAGDKGLQRVGTAAGANTRAGRPQGAGGARPGQQRGQGGGVRAAWHDRGAGAPAKRLPQRSIEWRRRQAREVDGGERDYGEGAQQRWRALQRWRQRGDGGAAADHYHYQAYAEDYEYD